VVEKTTEVGTRPVHYVSIGPGRPQAIDGEVVEEAQVCISVNGEELATFMCTPRDLEAMALGFLANEGVIDHLDEVRHLHVSQQNSCVDVWLQDASRELPQRRIITAGCGGGVTFDDLSQRYEPLQSDLMATPTNWPA
jgi:FdhD protein